MTVIVICTVLLYLEEWYLVQFLQRYTTRYLNARKNPVSPSLALFLCSTGSTSQLKKLCNQVDYKK